MSSPDYRVVVLANYLPDRQTSMKLFADLMVSSLNERGIMTMTLRPEPYFGGLTTKNREFAKWLGYIDKYIVFPRRLRKFVAGMSSQQRRRTVFHVCDHSNASYVSELTKVAHLVTCHDLMAVRLALRTLDGPAVRWTGRCLQAMIRRGIGQASSIACVSENTRRDLNACCKVAHAQITTIRSQLNYSYAPRDRKRAFDRVSPLVPDDNRPMLLHVGNNSWYKNRDGLLRIYKKIWELSSRSKPRLVIVGGPMTARQVHFLEINNLSHNVFLFANLASPELEALYSLASVFIFPSRYEGFGWPPIEAQACGCPVVAGNGGALSEVLADSALIVDSVDEGRLADYVLRILSDNTLSKNLRVAGFKNVERFRGPRMIDEYIKFYRSILDRRYS